MTQCPQCGRPVDTATDFCGSCGYYVGWDKTMAAANPALQRPTPPKEPVVTELPPQEPRQQRPNVETGPPPPPPTGPTIVCRVCGDVNPDSRTYCQRCGERLPAQGAFVPPVQQHQPPHPPPPYQRQLNPKVLLAVLLAVVLIIIGVIFAATRGGDNPPPQGNGTTPPTTEGPTGTSTETTPPVNPTKIDPGTIDADASSELPPDQDRGLSYGIGNTLDGDLRTAWNSNGKEVGTGAGQVLRYRFTEKVHLREIDLVNGYAKSDKSFTENGRIKAVAITTDAGTFEVTLDDSKNPQNLQQDFGVTDSVSLRVIAVYKGSKYPDLGLTEIAFLATPAN